MMTRRLYSALKALMEPAYCEKGHSAQLAIEENAKEVLADFEMQDQHLPDWATARNWDHALVPGAQLCTKDGRRTGNAHIVKIENVIYKAGDVSRPVFTCLTDAGSVFKFSHAEVVSQYYIGDWLSDPERVIKDFDRDGLLTPEPKE